MLKYAPMRGMRRSLGPHKSADPTCVEKMEGSMNIPINIDMYLHNASAKIDTDYLYDKLKSATRLSRTICSMST